MADRLKIEPTGETKKASSIEAVGADPSIANVIKGKGQTSRRIQPPRGLIKINKGKTRIR